MLQGVRGIDAPEDDFMEQRVMTKCQDDLWSTTPCCVVWIRDKASCIIIKQIEIVICVGGLTEREYWAPHIHAGYGTVSFYSAQRDDGLYKLVSGATDFTLQFERRYDLVTCVRAHLSTNQSDVYTFTDDAGVDVNIRPFIVCHQYCKRLTRSHK